MDPDGAPAAEDDAVHPGVQGNVQVAPLEVEFLFRGATSVASMMKVDRPQA